MGTIINSSEFDKLSELKSDSKKVVLVGGCFDIIHAGHLYFLRQAKEEGNTLVILLEQDSRIRELKGKGRPVNSQIDRAKVLASLQSVDAVILAKNMKNDTDYEALVKKIEPDIIAVTDFDRIFPWEKKYKIVTIKRRSSHSTTKIIERIANKK